MGKTIGLLYDRLGRSLGGVEAYIYHVAEELQRQGNIPILISPKVEGDMIEVAPPGVEVIWLKKCSNSVLPGFDIFKKLRHYAKQLKQISKEIDAFWSRSYLLSAALGEITYERPVLYIQANPVPYFTQMYAKDFTKNSSLKSRFRLYYQVKVVKMIELNAMNKSKGLIYLSKHEKEDTALYYNKDFSSKANIVHPGVDLKRFFPPKEMRNWENCLKTVTVCRLAGAKNLACLIKAVSILKSRGIDTESSIVGDGPLYNELTDLISYLGVSDRINLVGRRVNVEDYYRDADIFVLPSKYEPFGHVYIEALASGLPCVAIKKNPPAILVAADEIIDHLKTGYLIDDNSPELLANALSCIYVNRHLIVEWGINARKVAEEKYNWERSVKQLLEITFGKNEN